MPPPRAAVSVNIDFTKLETDHMPARATREKEIREWKREQRGKVGRCKLEPCLKPLVPVLETTNCDTLRYTAFNFY